MLILSEVIFSPFAFQKRAYIFLKDDIIATNLYILLYDNKVLGSRNNVNVEEWTLM